MKALRSFVWLTLALVVMSAEAGRAWAQLDLGQLDAGGDVAAKVPYTVTAQFTAGDDKQPARLFVTAKLDKGWHVYSITQAPGGPIRTTITVDPSESFKLAGDFAAFPAPDKKNEEAFAGLLVESHHDTVTWYAPIELAAGVDAATLEISGKLKMQACDATNCLPPTATPFKAKQGAGVDVTVKPDEAKQSNVGKYYKAMTHATIEGRLEPATVAPGGKAKLVLTAKPMAGFHVYALGKQDVASGSKPTLIVLEETSKLVAGEPLAAEPPHDGQYDKPISWTIELSVPADAKLGQYPISGLIGYQSCSTQCDFPAAASFKGVVTVAEHGSNATVPLIFEPAVFGDVVDLLPKVEVASTGFSADALVVEDSAGADVSLVTMLMIAFAGGLVLNLMPCVLPVVGLKVLAFVQQSHHSRLRIFALNFWYSMGLISVFIVLATLPVVFQGFTWGQQFGFTAFNVTLASIVFVMGLSLIGVWEIPIPGFLGHGKANDLAAREGAIGAFSKGVITTLLATPCSGPFLGTALGWALRQPAPVIYAVFTSVGLGMASPYLLIGVFPQLVRFLPKPGVWMETFKQLMGFVMLGTVVFLLSFIETTLVVPTVAFLIALWAACWWIGRTPFTARQSIKRRNWAMALGFSAVMGWFAFTWFAGVMNSRFDRRVDQAIAVRLQGMNSEVMTAGSELPWQPFSVAELQRLTHDGNTVMVEFTADWCSTCQTLAKFVLNTEPVKAEVEKQGVVTLLADYTATPREITEMLARLKSGGVPVLAIFPAGNPNRPIVFRDGYTIDHVLDALKQAGPSRSVGEKVAASR